MKKTKMVSLIAFLLAILFVFSACGTDSGSSAPDKNTKEPGETASNEGKLATWIGDITLRLVRADNPNQPMKVDNLVVQEIKKRTGVQLEVEAIPGADFTEKQKTMIATNNMPDILYDTYDIPDYAPSGVFAAVSDYLDITPNFKALLDENPELRKLYLNDKLYYFPELGRYKYRFGRSPMIRQDLFAKTGLETPKTFEDLHELLKAMKTQDPDTYPLANRNGTGNLLACFAYSMGSGSGIYFDPDVDGGKYLYGQAHEEFIPVMDYMAKLYKDGLLDPDYAVASSAQWQEKLASGRSTFFFDNPSFAVNFNQALASVDKDAKFAPMEIPYYAEGSRRGLFYGKHALSSTTISSKSKNVEAAMKLMDFLYSEEGCNLTNFGVEGQQYDKQGDEYVLRQDVIEQFSSQTDPVRGFYGSFGGGQLGLARYIDERANEAFFDEESKSWYDTWATWDFMGETTINPPLTEEENEQVKDINTNINTILDAEYDKFIMGTRPISEFSQVQQQIIDAGALKVEEIYNKAQERVQ